MKNDISQIIERFSSIRRSAFRTVAATLDIQLIHAEILEYLASCNKYSNTPQAVVDYLGQTKGSISQSLKKMEDKGLIKRQASKHDKRSSHLYLTSKGQKFHDDLKNAMPGIGVEETATKEALIDLLKKVQVRQNKYGFAVCNSCRYNKEVSKTEFQCGLTGEILQIGEAEKICREHEYS